MGTAKEQAEREYSAYTKQEQQAGKNLYLVYWKYHRQYCATNLNYDWDKADAKTKLVFTRTAKDTRYNG